MRARLIQFFSLIMAQISVEGCFMYFLQRNLSQGLFASVIDRLLTSSPPHFQIRGNEFEPDTV